MSKHSFSSPDTKQRKESWTHLSFYSSRATDMDKLVITGSCYRLFVEATAFLARAVLHAGRPGLSAHSTTHREESHFASQLAQWENLAKTLSPQDGAGAVVCEHSMGTLPPPPALTHLSTVHSRFHNMAACVVPSRHSPAPFPSVRDEEVLCSYVCGWP